MRSPRIAARVGALMGAVVILLASIPVSAVELRSVSLDHYISLLEEAVAAAPSSSPALTELTTLLRVTSPDGTTHSLWTNWPSPGDPNLKIRLQLVLDEAKAWRVPSAVPNPPPRLVAGEITNRPEFHEQKSLLRRIKDAIDNFFDDLGGKEEVPSPDVDLPEAPVSDFAQLVSVLTLVLAVLLIAFFIWRRMRSRERSISDDDEPEVIWDIGPADPAKLNEMATAAAAEGRYSDAVRAFYVANLLRLDAKGVINFKASDTNGAFRRVLQREFGAVIRQFDVATLIFERVHYGDHEANAEDWEATRSAWDGVWSGVAA